MGLIGQYYLDFMHIILHICPFFGAFLKLPTSVYEK